MIKNVVSKQSLQRFPLYLNYLQNLNGEDDEFVSATKIANALRLNQVLVRKDLSSISNSGKPKVGYNKRELINELEVFLGYRDVNDAIIVGAGRLGKALLYHQGFSNCGFNVLAAFDIDPDVVSQDFAEKIILPMSKFIEFCERTKVRIGIVTVPEESAQAVTNLLVECGILAIWNFTSVNLNVPENVLVHNENMIASMSLLSQHVSDKLQTNK